MTRVLRWRWIGSSVAAWLLLAAVNAILPAQAQAGCSHPWVQGAGNSASLFDRSFVEAGFHPLLPERGLPGSPERPGPCAGGACSQSPELPLSSTVQITADIDQWGDLPAEPTCCLPKSRGVTPKDDQLRPADYPTPIERPPRLEPAR